MLKNFHKLLLQRQLLRCSAGLGYTPHPMLQHGVLRVFVSIKATKPFQHTLTYNLWIVLLCRKNAFFALGSWNYDFPKNRT